MSNHSNNISFTSNINIVPKKTLYNILKGQEIDHLLESQKIIKSNDFYTFNVRTCTAGGLVSKTEKPVGFHFLNNIINFAKVRGLTNEILSKFKTPPTGGLIFGGKDLTQYKTVRNSKKISRKISTLFFDVIKKLLQKKVKNLSVLEEQTKVKGQTHYYYSQRNNTHYICAEDQLPNNQYHQVSSLEELKDFYKKISIAKTDKLFINGKEITRAEAPEIFA